MADAPHNLRGLTKDETFEGSASQGVMIEDCKGGITITIKNKVKNIKIIKCQNIKVIMNSSLSGAELTRSTDIECIAEGNMPLFALDNCQNVKINTSKASADAQFSTCESSNCTVSQEGGASLSLPEQYEYTIADGKVVSAKALPRVPDLDGEITKIAGSGAVVVQGVDADTAAPAATMDSTILFQNCKMKKWKALTVGTKEDRIAGAKNITIHKCDGITIFLSEEAAKAKIVASLSATLNVNLVPDNEVCIPHVFDHQIVDGKIISTISKNY